ncbi:MAG: hypothetical protein KGI24_08660 [Candidatus Omnitrophica bacterium]|nr:hypothetical protein [Candidatus Omnitrophota bacterium]MDE2230764.1 hypothetical protein [Candidatus Omnitrophota bacterium]
MNRTRVLGLLVLCFLTGCSSTEAIYKNYDKLIFPGKAVSAEQAKVIAQRKLIGTGDKDSYRISYPDIKTGPLADKYPDDWFVVFGHNWLSPLNKNAMLDTYTELRETQYLVVVDKKTGEVVFFGEWYPERENDFDWVFDRHAYNRKDPLALPPYKQSRELF